VSDTEMTHEAKVQWMAVWAAKNGLQLQLEGECGFGRECVGVTAEGVYPDYEWYDDVDHGYARLDKNGDVWKPNDAYHKHPCVAVLGRGEASEAQLYDWLRWFDAHGFKVERGDQRMDPVLGVVGLLMGKHRYVRMVRRAEAQIVTPLQRAIVVAVGWRQRYDDINPDVGMRPSIRMLLDDTLREMDIALSEAEYAQVLAHLGGRRGK